MRLSVSFIALLASISLPSLSLADQTPATASFTVTGDDGVSLRATVLESFDSPWAMTFLPDGRLLVTEKGGALWLTDKNGAKLGEIANAPKVTARGQGGLGDIIIHPEFAENGTVFISYVERDARDSALSGAAVERATLTLTAAGGTLSDRQVIWRQTPKVTGNGHYGHRLAIASDGHLFITSGERQKFTPAQNMAMNLGKIIRINQDGSIPDDNPFFANGGVAREVWSLGHRNPLGMAFDDAERLWVHEMGPKGGDELNRIIRAENYGYPEVSNGVHYSGKPIPDHDANPIYENPAISWTPVISPAGLVIYDGDLFADWEGDAFIGGLSSRALIRVTFSAAAIDNVGGSPAKQGEEPVAKEAARYAWDKRIREVEQGPEGALYVLEDKKGGRLIRLEPAS